MVFFKDLFLFSTSSFFCLPLEGSSNIHDKISDKIDSFITLNDQERILIDESGIKRKLFHQKINEVHNFCFMLSKEKDTS